MIHMLILLFMPRYGSVVMIEDVLEANALFASMLAFSFSRMPVCEGTHMNSTAF